MDLKRLKGSKRTCRVGSKTRPRNHPELPVGIRKLPNGYTATCTGLARTFTSSKLSMDEKLRLAIDALRGHKAAHPAFFAT